MKKASILVIISVLFTCISIYGQNTPISETIEKKYSAKMGNLRFHRNYIQFANIKDHEIQTETLLVYNTWYKPIDFHFRNIPQYISCKAIPQTLKPGQEGIILVTYDAVKRKQYGYDFYRLGIQTTDSIQPMKLFNVSANITEDFYVQ